jgi:hypothetical protein
LPKAHGYFEVQIPSSDSKYTYKKNEHVPAVERTEIQQCILAQLAAMGTSATTLINTLVNNDDKLGIVSASAG